jgi:hypothetical protein
MTATKPVRLSGDQIIGAEARAIAKEAYIYGFSLVTNYETLHKQAVDPTGHDYRAPFNTVASLANVATPEDKFVVTPNSDTPYSFLWMDLRAEPIVVTMPQVEKSRYYSGQLIDLYTFNFAYIGTRTHGNDGGDFLVAGPGWSGETPKGIKAVLHCETEFAYILFRTQLFDPSDLAIVKKIQAGYKAQPLSKFLGKTTPAKAAAVKWPAPAKDMLVSPVLFSYLNFMLQFCPTNLSEKELMERFAKLNIGAGNTFDFAKFSPELQKAVTDGIADVGKDVDALKKRINAGEVISSDLFGTREFLKNNYLYRFVGAKLGLYGNSGDEAIYSPYFVDANHQPLDAARTRYTLLFPKDQLPPAKAFWSLTMYDGKTQFLVANPLKRYLLNSTMLKSFKYGSDGSLTLYIQKDSPDVAEQSNWLPAPDGPFYAMLRLYMPAIEVQNGTWKNPPMEPVNAPEQSIGYKTAEIDTRIGKLTFELGLPTEKTVESLFDAVDFQRACQAYLWALPIVNISEWQRAHEREFGAGDGDIVIYDSTVDKVGILTPNATTPYIIGFANLSRTGPLVIDYPSGISAGGVLDFWQRPVFDMGMTGPDKGAGAKYLVIGPGQDAPQAEGYTVFHSPTVNIGLGYRVLETDPAKAKALMTAVRVYPYSQRDNPPQNKFLTPGGKVWSQMPPRGMRYWERLATILNKETLADRDRFFMAMLKPLGIEKGKAFQPDARQNKILAEAALVGEAMAKANSFDKRFEGALYRSDAHWGFVFVPSFSPQQDMGTYSQLDERAGYTYEAVWTTAGMVTKTPGVGQAYLDVYRDKEGHAFDGARTYRLHVPPHPPAKQFWSVTLYDLDTRRFIQNKEQIVDRSSRLPDLAKNSDGSVDIYFSPTTPKGFEKNWIPTVPGQSWFPLFRLYGPLEAYFDKSWSLPDIEKVQ